MKRIFSILIIGLFLISGSGTAFADHHHYKFGRSISEYRHSKHHDDDDDDYKKHYKKHREKEKKYYKKLREREKKYYKKVYGHKHKHHGYDHDKQLRKMIRYAARGGRDVHVWRVSDDTYVVKYYRGGHYYTQRLYPYTGRYGSRGIINVNWSPESYWTLLPSININIPVN